MENGRCHSVALALAAMLLASSAHAGTVAAGVSAEVVTPAEITVAAATEWLLSNSPGVLMLRIPGAAAPTGTIELTAGIVEGSGGTVVFSASIAGANALRQLIAQIATSTQPNSLGQYNLIGMTDNGTINDQGVQFIVIKASQVSEGVGTIVAIMTFD